MAESCSCVIIDSGSSTIKAGISGEEVPRSIFPSIVGSPKLLNGISSGLFKEVYIGNEAASNQKMLNLTSAIEKGLVVNWYNMEKLWQTAFEELNVFPQECPVLLSESPINTPENRENAAQIMFETFNVPALYIANKALLSLYANGKTTGLVIYSGAESTHIVPINENHTMHEYIESINLAGNDIDSYVYRMLSELEPNCLGEEWMQISKAIKEKLCYVALDFQEELKKESEIDRNYELPDGNFITLRNQRFRAPEFLFQPGASRMDTDGLSENAYRTIMKFNHDLSKEMLRNIVLSGGNTMYPGMAERLEKELKEKPITGMAVKINAPPQRIFSPWVGGSIIASMITSPLDWISNAEYFEVGPSIVHSKCT